MPRTITYHYYGLLLVMLVPVYMAWGSYRQAQQKPAPLQSKFSVGPAMAAAPAAPAIAFPSVLLVN